MVLTVVTMFIGLFVIIILAHKGVNGAVLFGMLAACVVYWVGEAIFFGTNPFASLATASFVPQFKDMADTTLFKFDFKDFISIGWFTAISLIITFCIIDMFDTIGTLVGTASRAGMVDKEGNMPNMKEALVSDSVATVVGAVTGTSTVTTLLSLHRVEAGGRTGLTAFTTGILFLACIFIAPLAAIIPAAATSSALIYVGILMLGGLKKVDFEDLTGCSGSTHAYCNAYLRIYWTWYRSWTYHIYCTQGLYRKSKGGFYPYLCYFASFPCEVLPCSVVF